MTDNDRSQLSDPFESALAVNLRAYAGQAAGAPTDDAVMKAVAARRARPAVRFGFPRIRMFAFAVLAVGATVGAVLLGAGGLVPHQNLTSVLPPRSTSTVTVSLPTD